MRAAASQWLCELSQTANLQGIHHSHYATLQHGQITVMHARYVLKHRAPNGGEKVKEDRTITAKVAKTLKHVRERREASILRVKRLFSMLSTVLFRCFPPCIALHNAFNHEQHACALQGSLLV